MTTNKKPAKKAAAKKAPAKKTAAKKAPAKKAAAKKAAPKKETASVRDSAASYFTDSEEFLNAWDKAEVAIEKQIDSLVPDKVEINTTDAKNWFKKFLRKFSK